MSALGWIPVVGPIVGGLAGGMIGYMAGSKFGQKVYEGVKTAAKTAKDTAKRIWETGKAVAKKAVSKVKDLFNAGRRRIFD